MTEIHMLFLNIRNAVSQIYKRNHQVTDYCIVGFVNTTMDHMRIYRMDRTSPLFCWDEPCFLQAEDLLKFLPTTGSYVAVGVDQEKKCVQLGYGAHTAENVKGAIVSALSYGTHESDKAYEHIIAYLVDGTIPVADGE